MDGAFSIGSHVYAAVVGLAVAGAQHWARALKARKRPKNGHRREIADLIVEMDRMVRDPYLTSGERRLLQTNLRLQLDVLNEPQGK